ncbi:DUF3265 domain-containing protein [Aeromonas veronii]|nr:DUF3265 domain-containing protein [Aeromonas veronii]
MVCELTNVSRGTVNSQHLYYVLVFVISVP